MQLKFQLLSSRHYSYFLAYFLASPLSTVATLQPTFQLLSSLISSQPTLQPTIQLLSSLLSSQPTFQLLSSQHSSFLLGYFLASPLSSYFLAHFLADFQLTFQLLFYLIYYIYSDSYLASFIYHHSPASYCLSPFLASFSSHFLKLGLKSRLFYLPHLKLLTFSCTYVQNHFFDNFQFLTDAHCSNNHALYSSHSHSSRIKTNLSWRRGRMQRYVRFHISGTDTRHCPLHMLPPQKAWFLC